MKLDDGVRARLAVMPVLVERTIATPQRSALLRGRAEPDLAIGEVHPSWLEGLDARTRRALVAPADPTDVWLARTALAELPPKAPPELPLHPTWLVEVGEDQIAFALGPAAASVPRLAPAITRIAKPPRRGQMGPQRAAIARCKDAALDDDLSVVRIACRAIAPHVATNRLASLQLTRALPRALGLVVERELAANSHYPLDHVPAWSALVGR